MDEIAENVPGETTRTNYNEAIKVFEEAISSLGKIPEQRKVLKLLKTDKKMHGVMKDDVFSLSRNPAMVLRSEQMNSSLPSTRHWSP
eukprot:15348357-Ditylum_brightwellii.AAC.2